MSSIAWDQYCAAECAYYIQRKHLVEHPDFIQAVAKALASTSDSDVALRLMLEVPLQSDALPKILPLVIELAIDGPVRNMSIAATVLKKYTENVALIRQAIELNMPRYLGSRDDFLLRRLAQILRDLEIHDLLADLLIWCRNQHEEEINEIASDFHSWGKPGST